MPRFHRFLAFVNGFEIAQSSRPKAAIHRSCCASIMFLQRLMRGALPTFPTRKTPGAERLTLAIVALCFLSFPRFCLVVRVFMRTHETCVSDAVHFLSRS